jgi:hypothetical protein
MSNNNSVLVAVAISCIVSITVTLAISNSLFVKAYHPDTSTELGKTLAGSTARDYSLEGLREDIVTNSDDISSIQNKLNKICVNVSFTSLAKVCEGVQ